MKRLIADGLSASRRRGRRWAARRSRTPSSGRRRRLAGDLRDALDRFDEVGANEVLDRLLAALSVETVLQDVLLPYLRILGDRWARGEASVAQEHFASALIAAASSASRAGGARARGRPSSSRARRGRSTTSADHLRDRGVAPRWRVTYLGQDTPFATIQEAVDAVDPQLVVLAVSEGTDLDANADAVRRLAERVPVAVGGAGVTEKWVRPSALGC